MATATFFVYPCIDFVLPAFIGFVGAFFSYTVAHSLHTTLKIFHQFFLNFVQVPFYFFTVSGTCWDTHDVNDERVNVTARCNFLGFSRHWASIYG